MPQDILAGLQVTTSSSSTLSYHRRSVNAKCNRDTRLVRQGLETWSMTNLVSSL